MKKKEKIWITVLLIILVIAIIFMVNRNKANKNVAEGQQTNEVKEEFVQVLDNGTKLNTSEKFSKTRTVDGIEVGNIQLTHTNGISTLLADAKNTTSQDKGLTAVIITLLDKQGNKLEEIDGLISPVKAGQIVQINVNVSADYANAYDFTIVKK